MEKGKGTSIFWVGVEVQALHMVFTDTVMRGWLLMAGMKVAVVYLAFAYNI